ncbi:hypothetical protein F8388_019745 [Cannabis sativa]|nr:hypothetical protein F8388_019745 [Cannabis sativa]
MEQRASLLVGVTVEFYGGELNGINYSDPAAVKKYARRAELGESNTCPSITITFLFWNSSPISPRFYELTWGRHHETRPCYHLHVQILLINNSRKERRERKEHMLFVMETRLPIPSFPESHLTDEIQAREGIPKPISLAESLSI